LEEETDEEGVSNENCSGDGQDYGHPRGYAYMLKLEADLQFA